MNKTTLMIACIGILAVIAWGELRYSQGRTAKQNEILSQPHKPDTTHLPPVIEHQPTVTGETVVPSRRPPRPARVFSGETVDSLQAEIVRQDSVIHRMSEPMWITLDTAGAVVHIVADPVARKFAWQITPPPRIVEPMLIRDTFYVPLERPRWSAAGYVGYPGAVGFDVGFDGFSAGRMFYQEYPPLTFGRYEHTFDLASLF